MVKHATIKCPNVGSASPHGISLPDFEISLPRIWGRGVSDPSTVEKQKVVFEYAMISCLSQEMHINANLSKNALQGD